MTDMTWFTLASTVAALLAIALGVMFPALAMGRAISSALDALSRQGATWRIRLNSATCNRVAVSYVGARIQAREV